MAAGYRETEMERTRGSSCGDPNPRCNNRYHKLEVRLNFQSKSDVGGSAGMVTMNAMQGGKFGRCLVSCRINISMPAEVLTSRLVVFRKSCGFGGVGPLASLNILLRIEKCMPCYSDER